MPYDPFVQPGICGWLVGGKQNGQEESSLCIEYKDWASASQGSPSRKREVAEDEEDEEKRVDLNE